MRKSNKDRNEKRKSNKEKKAIRTEIIRGKVKRTNYQRSKKDINEEKKAIKTEMRKGKIHKKYIFRLVKEKRKHWYSYYSV